MKNIDDGPDGLNDRAFDRALGIRTPDLTSALQETADWQTIREAACAELRRRHKRAKDPAARKRILDIWLRADAWNPLRDVPGKGL